MGLAGTLFSGNLTDIADTFSCTPGRLLSCVTLAVGAAFLVSIPVWVVANQNHNRKWLLWCGAVVSLAGFLVTTFAPAALFVVLGAFLFGASTSGVETSVATLAGELRPKQRAFFVGATQAFFAVGAGATPFLIAGLLKAGLSWRHSFAAAGVVSVFVVALVPASHYHRHSKPAQPVNVARALTLLRERRFALLLVCMICYVGVEIGITSICVQFLEKVYHAGSDTLLSKMPIAAFWLTMVPGRLIAGHLADRIGETKVICGALLLGTVTSSLFLFSPGPAFALLCVAASGLVLAGVWPCIVSAVSRFYTDLVETRIALTVCAGGVGVMVFGALLGAIYDLASASSRAHGARFTAALIPIIAALSLGSFVLFLRSSARPRDAASRSATQTLHEREQDV